LVAILGIVQVALGLTLWGSPEVLFILFAVWAFLLFIAYFVLSYRNQPSLTFDDRGTYISERTETTRRSRSHRGGGLGALATAGAAGAGLAALRHRSRSRSASRRRGGRQEVLSSHHGSRVSESYADEKYREDGQKGRTFKERLFGAGAAAGGIFAVKSLFSRKKKHTITETGSDISYSRPIGQSEVTQTDISRLEEGRAPESPGRDHWRRVEEREAAQAAAMGASPLRQGHRATHSASSFDSFDSRTSISDAVTRPKESHNLRNTIATVGVLGFLKNTWNRRRNKEEDEHVASIKEQDIEEERMARQDSTRRKYTGDGNGPRRTRPPPSTIFSESELSTNMTPAPSRPNLPPPPRASTNLAPPESIGGPSLSPGPAPGAHSVLSDLDSELIPGGGRHNRHRNSGSAAHAAGAAAAVTSAGSPSRRDHSRRRNSRDDSIASPPVSVKVKMHNDGRHVTLRRLNEEEAAAERKARSKETHKVRDSSMSSLGNSENRKRWRRNEAIETAQAQEMAQQQSAASTLAPLPMPEPFIPPPPPGPPPGGAASHIPLPPPPPLPAAAGSILSSPSGQAYGTETDVSNFDSNRRRRRAERAQAKAAKGGKSVDFS
jgi:hypothetical protein